MKAEFIDLSKRLRQERLYVASEKKQILQLNARIVGAVEQLSHSAWKNQQQRETLEKLILARPDSLPHMSCQRAQVIDRAQFVDAHRILGHYVSCYGEFLQHLRENPSEVATCLGTCHVSSVGNEGLAPLIFIVLGSVYGNCILQQDEENVLLLLRHLIRLQLATSENPRRLLVQGLGAFSRLYRSFSESHFPARVFLTAALHQPLLSVLMSDEVYLDGDSNKALMRLSPDERERLFGADESSCEYLERLKAYMQTIRQKVICLTSEFIAGITGHLFCFPPSIAWLIRQVHEILSQAGSYSPSEVRAVCVDLIFPLLICPAIVNPEPYGISSQAHVTPTARFNLIRIATVLQGLAHSVDGSEDLEGTLGNLYAELDRGAVTSFVDALVSLVSDDDLPPRTLMEVSSPLHGITRSAALITEDDLATLISFFRAASRTPECEDLKNLQTILSNLPHLSAANGHSGSRTSGENGSSQTQGTPPSASKRQGLLNKVSFPRRRPNEEDGLNGEVLSDGSSDSSPGAQQVLVVPLQTNGDGECPGMLSEMKFLSLEGRSVRYGEEEDALSLTTAHTTHRDLAQDPLRTGGGGTKRTRFSLSQDDGSIGNASDNLEGVSETASNPSPASSIGEEEEEVINDNLSDMVSANVSGRGTPNVSGRETPSSQVTESDSNQSRPTTGGPVVGAERDRPQTGGGDRDLTAPARTTDTEQEPQAPPRLGGNRDRVDSGRLDALGKQQSRVDIEEKFGKFELRPLLDSAGRASGCRPSHPTERDEVVSMVSDTWSTDVLASDTETLDQAPDRTRKVRTFLDIGMTGTDHLMDNGSEGWSTDVLASDTERMTEVDTDDAYSITAKSDETGRSEPGDTLDRDQLISGFNPVSPPLSSGSARDTLPPILGPSPSSDRFSRFRQTSTASSVSSNASIGHASNAATAGGSIPPPSVASSSAFSPPPSTSSLADQQPPSSPPASTPAMSEGKVRFADEVGLQITTHFRLTSSSGTSSNEASVSSSYHAGRLSVDLGSLSSTRNVSDGSEPMDTTGGRMHADAVAGASGGGAEDIRRSSSSPPHKRRGKEFLTNLKSYSLKLPFRGAGGGAHSLRNKGRGLPGPTPAPGPATAPVAPPSRSPPQPPPPAPAAEPVAEGILVSLEVEAAEEVTAPGPPETSDRVTPEKREDLDVQMLAVGGGERGDCHPAGNEPTRTLPQTESSDDILAKYRRKAMDASQAAAGAEGAGVPPPAPPSIESMEEDNPPLVPTREADSLLLHEDAKKKLRHVLSHLDIGMTPHFTGRSVPVGIPNGDLMDPSPAAGPGRVRCRSGSGGAGAGTDLSQLLKLQLAEAINLQDRAISSQLQETLRCVHHLDDSGCKRLLQELREEYRRRSPYISYLTRSKQGLLSTTAYLDRLSARVSQERSNCSHALVSLCVRLYLEKRDSALEAFRLGFSSLTLSDEKASHVERFLEEILEDMLRDPTWTDANEEQLEIARRVVERAVMSSIYLEAMHPNGDGDRHRDDLFHSHMIKLGELITPGHKDLQIPEIYHHESPWPSAQAEIASLCAYKTPQDKLDCVLRCCSAVMNLLSLANEKAVPADDFTPVLVFVLIKANPHGLLSTIQFVESFYGKRLCGEDHYWWTQFSCAVEYIKTMMYSLIEG